MKKLITIIMVGGLALTIQAQDITNTLGPSGNFIVEDDSNNEIIKVDASGTFHFKNEVPGSSTQFDLYNAGHNLKLNFYKAKGTPSAPVAVDDFVALGILDFYGYTGSGYQVGAAIAAEVEGASSGFIVPTSLTFRTQETGDLHDRMTIKPNGYVGIGFSTPDTSPQPKSTLDVDGSVSYSYKTGGTTTLGNSTHTYGVTSGTVFLPTAVGIEGRVYVIKFIGSSGTAAVTATSSQSIDGGVTFTLLNQWDFVTVQSDGANWLIIGRN